MFSHQHLLHQFLKHQATKMLLPVLIGCLVNYTKKTAALSEKRVRRRRKHTGKCREYQRNLVVIDHPGTKPPAVQVLHDYDKVYEGSLSFTSAMSEDSIREDSPTNARESDFYDFTSVEPDDFEFVKCVNKRVRVPDGKACYDGDGIRDLYHCANIYVRLTKSFCKYGVSMHATLSTININHVHVCDLSVVNVWVRC